MAKLSVTSIFHGYFKKYIFFIFYFKLIFLDYFNVLISKIIFKK